MMMNFFQVCRICIICILAVGSCLEVVISLLLIKSHRPGIESHYSQYRYSHYRPLVAVPVKVICRSTVDDVGDDASHLDSKYTDRREDFRPTSDSTVSKSNNFKSSTLNKFRDKSVLILGTFHIHLHNTIPYPTVHQCCCCCPLYKLLSIWIDCIFMISANDDPMWHRRWWLQLCSISLKNEDM